MPTKGSFATTEEDLVAANRLHARQLWNMRAILRGWILGSVALALIAFWHCERTTWTMLWVPFVVVAFMALGAVVSQLTFSHVARRHYRQARAFWHPTTIEWDDDSVRFTSDRGKVQWRWSDFYSWAADERSILLYQRANSFIAVPTKALHEDAKVGITAALKNAGVVVRSSR